MTILVIEEVAGQHQDMCPTPERLRYCECRQEVERGEVTCFYCGKYIKALFHPGSIDQEHESLRNLLRLRPYAEG